MSNQPLGAVIVGTGFGVLTHLRALRGAGIEAKALVGRNPEKTRDRANKVEIEHGLTSLTEALALPGVDLVTIATPPHTHCEIALEAIAAGKHVLCEKPFARSAEEGKQMLDAAEAAGIVHMLGTEFRFSTGQALATRSVREGLIGEARLVVHGPGRWRMVGRLCVTRHRPTSRDAGGIRRGECIASPGVRPRLDC